MWGFACLVVCFYTIVANVGVVHFLVRKLAQTRAGFGDATGRLGNLSVVEPGLEIGMSRLGRLGILGPLA